MVDRIAWLNNVSNSQWLRYIYEKIKLKRAEFSSEISEVGGYLVGELQISKLQRKRQGSLPKCFFFKWTV